ncbi:MULTISPECIES: helix-turn-helix transcriptional regulator [Gordonia]|uniref:WYL domain-containing protein n=2 Tax=Gordonia TaxID=2053 RepID=A0A9X3D890_9ACTN|nr:MULTISPECIES: WYL domain-containing protein [Gordonia]MAU82530.1 protein pafC [Gordonia sp. (in: high G+C Gram-positive bacteria)]MCF3940080.1 WYL domain-containing protein [Gordonia tangerina]MCX2966640.1 WYL domain-containing protein [Gordonia aquimaris]
MTPRPDRLSRLLALVPYFATRDGIALDQAARDLGISQTQLTKDLELLFVCGLPGYFPHQLIDLQFEHGFVDVIFTAGMDRPLRLTSAEASTMLVALQALLDLPGAVDQEAARRAIAKIEAAVGSSDTAVRMPAGSTDSDNPTFASIREAVTARRALRIRYYSATRDSVSDRIVDPIGLQTMDNHTYLEAWCRMSEGVRLFRFDRVDEAEKLDEPASPPEEAKAHPQRAVLSENPDLPSVQIEIDPGELWVLDYYLIEPLESLETRVDPQAPVRARLVYGSPEWLTRFLLGFGGRVRVISDSAIADSVISSAAAARARYT